MPKVRSAVSHVLFRPYQEVPRRERAEAVLHIETDRSYIAAKNFEVVTPDGEGL